jgi:acetyl coenzyme A synthetase (ADP forming)-like protein
MFDALFKPRGVAVIGASQTPSKLGYSVARNLILSGYPGELHFVNPHGGELFQRRIYTDLDQVPDPVDLAMILIPAPAVPGAVEACGRRGVKVAIIGSGGFREVGDDGAALERQCLDIAREHGLRLLGPNCIGYLDTHLPIDTTFLPLPGPIPGDIAFLSHSGAICEAVIDWARGQGFGLSRLVSLGNQADLSEAELLPAVADDPNTAVIALYLEGISNGDRFIAASKRVVVDKPVLAIRVGRSERGRAAVASHTGALAGQEAAFQAALHKAGVIRADNSEALFDWARALAWCPLPKGKRVAVLTNAGGPGAIAVDALDACGMTMADLSPETTDQMRRLLPAAASLRNPVDMLASAGPHEYASCLEWLLADDQVDSAMVILPPPPVSTAADIAGAMIPVVLASDKPVVIALMGENLITQAAHLFRQAKIPDYRFPERAADALRVLSDRAAVLAKPRQAEIQPTSIDRQAAEAVLSRADDGWLPMADVLTICHAYGLPLPPTRLAGSAEEAVQAANALGYPVALKVDSADLPHKSDVGGVKLGLADEEAVAAAYLAVTEGPAAASPQARVDGAIVQPMLPKGQEVIVGVVRDRQFGPLAMFGSGGVEVEGLKDTAFALPPFTEAELDDLLSSTWAGRRLAGYRHLPPADQSAVRDCLVRLGRLALDQPAIAEVEINPLRVYQDGNGAAALDIRMRIARS